MQSNGGLAAVGEFSRGVERAVRAGRRTDRHGLDRAPSGCPRLIGFDMGGTSTDVSLIDGELPRRFEHIIAGVRLQQPMLDVHTIAAGGGSIVSFSDGRFAVGPASAGSDPGPTCYGRGGPLTLTDVQVLLGRLRPDTLPAVFGRDGKARIDTGAVASEFAALVVRVREIRGESRRPRRSRRHFSRWVSKRWLTPFVRSRPDRGSTQTTSRCSALEVRRVSTPAAWRERQACAESSSIRLRVCCLRLGSEWRIGWRCAVPACRLQLSEDALCQRTLAAGAGDVRVCVRSWNGQARDELATHSASVQPSAVEHCARARAGDSETSLSVPVAATGGCALGLLGRSSAAVWIRGDGAAGL